MKLPRNRKYHHLDLDAFLLNDSAIIPKAKIPIPTIIHERIAGPGAAELARSLVIPNTPLPIDELTTRATSPHLLIPVDFFSISITLTYKIEQITCKRFLLFCNCSCLTKSNFIHIIGYYELLHKYFKYKMNKN